MTLEQQLLKVRERIDALDQQIQTLISERAACAKEIGKLKQHAGAGSFYRPEREAEVLRKVIARNTGELTAEDMARLFREIMSACLALEEPLRIAFLGPEGTFTQTAALKHFGHAVITVPFISIDEVFREVEAGAVHYGVVPVENSSEGVVTHTLDRFINSPLKICGEVELRIHHHLLSLADDLASISQLYVHHQAQAQCRRWLDLNLSRIPMTAVSSNAAAAQLASRDPNSAAIAGNTAADIYKLKILASNIEDEPDNTTRFLIIGPRTAAPSGKDKTSLLISAHNRPGALHSLLTPFANHGISMTRIESRPSRRGTWTYVFFVDVEGHAEEPRVAAALQELEQEVSTVKILGSYPCAVL